VGRLPLKLICTVTIEKRENKSLDDWGILIKDRSIQNQRSKSTPSEEKEKCYCNKKRMKERSTGKIFIKK
jgi:hypothetical protein